MFTLLLTTLSHDPDRADTTQVPGFLTQEAADIAGKRWVSHMDSLSVLEFHYLVLYVG